MEPTNSYATLPQQVKEERDLLYSLAREAEAEGDAETARDFRRQAVSYGMAW